MKLEVKYFALLREALGKGSETVELDRDTATVAELREFLIASDAACAGAFASVRRIRAAVNGEMAPETAVVKDGDEVAFFPPVTGG